MTWQHCGKSNTIYHLLGGEVVEGGCVCGVGHHVVSDGRERRRQAHQPVCKYIIKVIRGAAKYMAATRSHVVVREGYTMHCVH